MNSITFSILLITLAAMAVAQSFPTKTCRAGEHSVLYCPRKAEPSCANPTLHEPSSPGACGIPDCFCNTGTLRDTTTNACVKPENCPKK